jgi:hypothetical protein
VPGPKRLKLAQLEINGSELWTSALAIVSATRAAEEIFSESSARLCTCTRVVKFDNNKKSLLEKKKVGKQHDDNLEELISFAIDTGPDHQNCGRGPWCVMHGRW